MAANNGGGGGGGSQPDWQGLLKWSLAQSDGSKPSRQLSEVDRKWFMEAMEAQSVDIVKRMKEITLVMKTPSDVLEAQGVTPENIEEMLDELQEHVENIDMANDLHSIGGLVPLIEYLKNTHAGIRAKAAEVISTIVQNNPKSQQLVMAVNGFEPLMANFKSDPDVTAKTKSLGALSSLLRHNEPAIAAFRLANGFAALRDALACDDARLQRKALHMMQFLLRETTSDRNLAIELGFPRVVMHLVSSEDSGIREAALWGLSEFTRDKACCNALASDDKMRSTLQNRIDAISTMAADDLHAAREEREEVDYLWRKFYNESSPLSEKGLLALPGEDVNEQPPDVTGKFFEPPLRAWAAKPAGEAEEEARAQVPQPPTLLLGPPGACN